MEILELTLALFHCRGGHGPALARAVRQCGSVAVLFEATPVQKAGLGLSEAQLALLSPDPSVSACALRSVKADIERDREWAQAQQSLSTLLRIVNQTLLLKLQVALRHRKKILHG